MAMVSPKRSSRCTRSRRNFDDKIETYLLSHVGSDCSLEHILVFTITAFVTLAVYLKTLSPSIAGGDSGELVAEGCQLGTAHPPGYPLYTILVFLVTKLGSWVGSITFYPINSVRQLSPALLVNAMSSIFGAATSGLISSSVFLLGDSINMSSKIVRVCCAIVTGLLHSFSPLSWQYSVTAEVFALNNFFVAWIVHTAIRFAFCRSRMLLYQGALIAGLALANQHTSILLLVPVICFVIYWAELYEAFILYPSQRRFKSVQRSRWELGRCAVVFLLTFSVLYLTMPLFSSYFPHAGAWGDVRSVAGFFRHLLRQDYGTLKLFSGNDQDSEGPFERIKLWSIDFATIQCNTVLVLIFAMSVLRFLQSVTNDVLAEILHSKSRPHDRKKTVLNMLSASLCFYLVIFHCLSNLPLKNPLFYGIHQRFWLHPNVLAFILIGDGLNNIIYDILRRRRWFCLGEKYASSFLIFTLFLFVYEHCRRNYEKSDHSRNTFFRNYASSILQTLPKDSLLFINYDQQWTSVRYLQECEHIRSDITSINLSMMSYPWW